MTGAWTLTPAPPSPTWDHLPTHMPGRAHTTPRPSIPEATKLHVADGAAGEEAHQSPHGGWGPRAALPQHLGKEAAVFSAKDTKVLMPLCTRRAGQCPQQGLLRLRPPPVPVTAPVLASRGPRGQQNSGTHSHLSPPPTSLSLGGEHECPWIACLQAIWPRPSLGVRSSWPWAEALPQSLLPTSRPRLPGTS